MECGDLVGGRFEIGAVVREGGMGLVFRAFDRETGRRCAVKTLLEASKTYIERFEREAALLSSLRHPAVVSYVAHGFHGREPYLVMDWLDGEELGDRLARGPLSLADAREVAARIADALGAAHVLGIVHRDVKPSNVVLVSNDVTRATLIDFGVARADVGPRRTRTGLVLGTPGYMAPEQARASRDVDARADVYALGCVLFECLTGKPPFAGEHPVAVLAKVLLDEAPRLASIAPAMPPDLDALVARMLSKDPTRRPESGDAVARALRASRSSTLPPNESVMPESITDDERVVVHVILSARFGDATDPHGRTIPDSEGTLEAPAFVEELEERFGLHVDVLADGSVLATVRPGALGPKGGAARAAAIARDLAAAAGQAVAIASGFERVKRGMPLGDVVDRAVELSRRAAREGTTGVVTDELTESLLGEHSAPLRPLVGRDRELAVLDGLLDEIENEHAARIAVVTSPPGGGKSRLLDAALERFRAHETPPRVCSVRGDETTSQSPLGVATDVVFSLCGIGGGEPPHERRARLAARLETTRLSSQSRQRVLDFVGDVIGATTSPSLALLAARADAMTMSDHIQRAFVDFLRGCSEELLVVAIDDLQWCDRATFRLLEAAMRELEDAPLCLIGLARPDFDDAFPAAFAERALTRLPLSPLGKRAAEALVRDVIHQYGGDARAEVVTEIVKRGEGNAFMLAELARGAREGHALGEGGGTTAVVASRFEALPLEARRVLRAASIVGQRFSEEAVAVIVGAEPSAAWLQTAWDELERAEIIEPSAHVRAFRHALLRDAAYATLTDDDKTRGHKLAARYFEAVDAGAAIVAHHAELGGDLDQAARAYVDAAQSALDAIDLAGANERVKAAIRCGAGGKLLGRAHRIAADAAFWLGTLRDCEDHAARAIDLVDPSTADFFTAAQHLVASCSRLGQAERALETTRRILTSPATAATTAARATALLTAAAFLPLQGQIDLAKAILRDLKPVVGALGGTHPALPARYSRSHSVCAMASGDIVGFLESTREAAERFAAVGDRRNELAQRGNVVYALVELGEYASAATEGASVVADAEALGLRNVVALAKQNAGYALVKNGAEDAGVPLLREALAEFTTQGHARMAGGTHIYLASAHLTAGRDDDALAEIDQALEMLASTPPLRAYALAVRARIDLRRGDRARSEVGAQEAMRLLDSLGGIDSGETEVFLAAAEAKIAAGDESGARVILKRGRERLEARASRLDEARRLTFLTKVRANAELSKLASRLLT
jgi:tetratricopeptide (TPR) repeat protein